MSICNYNHSHQEQANSSHAMHGTSNVVQTRFNNQNDNDYLNRGYSSLAHTRPTSKTALLVRQRRAMLEQLSCYLCKGYLIDATTVDECMDSFCKSCIVIHLRTQNNCPKCGTLIHKTNPLGSIRSDKVLQDIVYKLVPGLYDEEMKRRRDFYRNLYALSSDEDDEGSSSSSFNGRLSGEQYGVITHPKSFYKLTDHIDLSIEPQTRGDNKSIYYDNKRQSIVTCFTGNSQQQQRLIGQAFSSVDSEQFKTYLRCPAKLTAFQLKKFIASKFNICRYDTIHLLYLNETLRDEYSLIDIAYIYDWRGIEHMRLFYIIERDLSKSDQNDPNNNQQFEEASSRGKVRQSVGTSTQTIKRVCIDPNPKIYEELNNNDVKNSIRINGTANSSGGRIMRSQRESSTSTNRATTSYLSQSPTLRSNVSCRTVPVSSSNQNGISSRETIAIRVQGTQVQSNPTAQTIANNQLPRMKQDKDAKETRSYSRNNNNEAPSSSIPKININLSSLSNQTGSSGSKNINTYSKMSTGMVAKQREVVVTTQSNTSISSKYINSNIRQLVPWKGYPAMTCTPGSSQGSMVTLANFTGAHSNNVLATSVSAATTMSSSHKTFISPSTSSREVKHPEIKNGVNQTTSKPPQGTPQFALSYVTERGITIIRRLNTHDEAAAAAAVAASTSRNSLANTATKTSTPVPSLPAPPTTSQSGNYSGSISNTSSSYQPPAPSNYSSAGTSSGSQTTMSSAGQGGISPKHPTKCAKPVYKTFVDITKLKTPNFKKLGHTAKHTTSITKS